MLPTITIFNRTIAMYGTMILLGIIIGSLVAILLGKKIHLKSEDVLFTIIFGIIGAVILSKALYLLIDLPYIIKNFNLIIHNMALIKNLLSGGFVFYGGLIGAMVGAYYYCHKYKLYFPTMLLVIIPVIPLMHSIGRIGCFFAGCCYGIEYHGFGSVIFTKSPFPPKGLPLFPVQLVESFFNMLLFVILLIIHRKGKNYKRLISVYIIYYSIMRFILEFFRGDVVRGISFGLSTSQWISLGLLAALPIWNLASKKIKSKPAQS